MSISELDIVGKQVIYRPQDINIEGEIQLIDNQLVIEWEDGAPDTHLDSDLGKEILKECQVL